MKIMDLKPGVYRLTREVINPKPDRRHRGSFDNWAMNEKLWKGFRFRVKDARWMLRERGLNEDEQTKHLKLMCEKLVVPGMYEIENFDGRFNKAMPITYAVDHARNQRLSTESEGAYLRSIIDALEPAPITPDVFFSDHNLDIGKDAQAVLISMLRHGIIDWTLLEEGFNALRTDQEEYARINEGKERGPYEDLPLPIYEPEG